jgi:hypothetical protein
MAASIWRASSELSRMAQYGMNQTPRLSAKSQYLFANPAEFLAQTPI